VRNKFSVSFDRVYRKTYKKTDAHQLRHNKIYIHNQNNALKMGKQISYAKKVFKKFPYR
jgi:ribosomal protein S17